MLFDKERIMRDKAIDPNELDVECLRQAETFFDWSELKVDAEAEADRLKFELLKMEAKLGIECRAEPEDFGIKNVTETSVKAAVMNTTRYQTAYNLWGEADRVARLYAAAVNAMEMKRKMLEQMVKLHGQQYFAGPNIPRDLDDAWKNHQKQRQTRIDANSKMAAAAEGRQNKVKSSKNKK